ncbi:type VII secretion integral membrane protein EccD [Mycobacterium sp. E3305]|uniref:type VII secretion integral membrane protein EccD n=1 Tax=Mycobacterium sp. E3305 TaxID=1834145 RepID=UPI0007FBD35A|nr:type VII secretion integral membrane protein EccD [Mycobacterium sp. E3305]OBG76119.1 type VII secretion integral membrane protein EccD [Mycobacterium sp. E3305]
MFSALRLKGSRLPATDLGLCRVSIHAGSAVADLALPAEVPVGVLTPSIVDILQARDGDDGLTAKRYHLSPPGLSALGPSKTLAQNGIGDGAVLLLSQGSPPPPPFLHHDPAEAVSEALAGSGATTNTGHRFAVRLAGALAANALTVVGMFALTRNTLSGGADRDRHATVGVLVILAAIALVSAALTHRFRRDAVAGLALNAMATTFAAVGGFLAVPGGPGVCNVLLAATAAAATCVLAIRASRCAVVVLTAVSCAATIVAIAALVGAITGAPPYAVGAASALTSLGLLGVAARLSIVLAGLSPRVRPMAGSDETEANGTHLVARALRADAWASSLLAAFASSAAVGAVVTVLAGAPRLSCIAFGSITGALLLLRARTSDNARMLTLVIAGIAVVGTTFGVAVSSAPGRGPGVAAATATLAAGAVYFGFVAPAISTPRVLCRAADALEWLALVATAPLTCWICGLYGAVRGLHFR